MFNPYAGNKKPNTTTMKPKSLANNQPPRTESLKVLVLKAAETKRLEQTAKKHFKALKADYKLARKAFKQAKKAVKRARKMVEAAEQQNVTKSKRSRKATVRKVNPVRHPKILSQAPTATSTALPG